MAVWLDIQSIELKVAAWVSTKVALKVGSAAEMTVVRMAAKKVELSSAMTGFLLDKITAARKGFQTIDTLEVGRVVSSAPMSARWLDTQQVVQLVILKAHVKVG